MRDEFKETGAEQIVSRRLGEEIGNRLDRREQVMVLLNRRGYSPIVLCRTCGNTVQCRNCDIPMTHHKSARRIECHYCGYIGTRPRDMPQVQQRVRVFSRRRIGKTGRTSARHVPRARASPALIATPFADATTSNAPYPPCRRAKSISSSARR